MGATLPGGGAIPDFGSQIEILRSRAVLASAVESLGLQLVLFSHPDRRSALFDSVAINSDAPARTYLIERSRGQFFLINAFTEERVATLSPGAVIEEPGIRFRVGPGIEDLTDRAQFQIVPFEVAIERLRRTVRIEQGSGRDFIRVSYRSPDRVLSADVANAVAASYQEYQARTARQAATHRREVVAGEIQLLADSLRRAQEQVETYQSSRQLLNPDVEGNALMSALLETENEIRRLRFERGMLESLVAGLQGGDPDDESLRRIMALGRELVPAGSEMDQRLQSLQAERRALTGGIFGATDSAPEVQVLDDQIASTREQMRIVAEQSLQLLHSRVTASEERVAELRAQMGGLPARASELSRLQQRVDAVQGVFDQLVERYYEAQIAESVEAGDVALVDPAPVPLGADPSGRLLNIMMALFGGLIVGGLGALVLEQFDSRIRRPWDAEKAGGLQILGAIPSISSRSIGAARSRMIGMEACRGVRTNLRFAAEGTRPRTIAICSAAPAEGKTTMAVNLAMAMAEEGERVLLVDADLRRPRLHEMLGVEQGPGLVEVLSGKETLADVIHTSSIHPTVHLLASGRAKSGHASLVGSQRFRDVLRELAEQYDTVLVDTPPVLAMSDASLIASAVDGNLLVVRSNGTDREELEEAVAQLHRVRARMLGIIVNDVKLRSAGYPDYYGRYYPDATAAKSGKRRKKLLLEAGTAS